MRSLILTALALTLSSLASCSLIVNSKLSEDDAAVSDGPRRDTTVDTSVDTTVDTTVDTSVDTTSDTTVDGVVPDTTVDGPGPVFLPECGSNTVATNLTYPASGSGEGFYAMEIGDNWPVVAVPDTPSSYKLRKYDDGQGQFLDTLVPQLPSLGTATVGRIASVTTDDGVVHVFILVTTGTQTNVKHTFLLPGGSSNWAPYGDFTLAQPVGATGFWITAAGMPGGGVMAVVTAGTGLKRWILEALPAGGGGSYQLQVKDECTTSSPHRFPRLSISPNGLLIALTYFDGNQASLELTGPALTLCNVPSSNIIALPGGDAAAAPMALSSHNGNDSLHVARGDGSGAEHVALDATGSGGAGPASALPVNLGVEAIDVAARNDRVYVLVRDANGPVGNLALVSAEVTGANTVGPFHVDLIARDGIPGRLRIDNLGRAHVLYEEKQGANDFKVDYVCLELPYGGGGPTGQCSDGFCTGGETCTTCPLDCFCGPSQGFLVAFWPFDDWTGTQASDASGNGHLGMLDGDIAADFLTGLGAAFDFFVPNGGIVEVPSLSNNSMLSTPVAISLWIHPLNSGNAVLIRNASMTSGFEVTRTPNNQIRVAAGGPTGPSIMGGQAPNGTWTHIFVAFRNGPEVRLYINGTQVASGPHQVGQSVAPVQIGGDRPPPPVTTIGRPFDGQIDHVKIFNMHAGQSVVSDEFSQGPP